MFYFLWQNTFLFPLLSMLSMFFGKQNSLRASMPLTLTLTDLTPSAFGVKKLPARNHTFHVVLVEDASVITGPKYNKGTICNNIWTQL